MIKVRRGKIQDLDAIIAIENACFEYPWSRLLFESDLKDNPNAVYWVAYDEGEPERILGFIGTHNIVGEINITNVAVDPSARRKGAGDALISYMTDYFSDKDIVGITLEVRDNNEPAIALYRKYGFKEEGLRKNYYRTGEDAIIMWKRKNDGV